jgi:hypothetical protein
VVKWYIYSHAPTHESRQLRSRSLDTTIYALKVINALVFLPMVTSGVSYPNPPRKTGFNRGGNFTPAPVGTR